MKKDRNRKDLTEAEEIKKRWQNYTGKLYRKGLNDPDNHEGVVSQLELHVLECEAKWAFGSIIMNKVSGGDRNPAELFQILKDNAVKVLHSICEQIRKTQQCHGAGKGQFSFQSQRKAMAKNVQTIIQLCLFHMLARLCSKSFKLGFNST